MTRKAFAAFVSLCCLAIGACARPSITVDTREALPAPVTNNAVAWLPDGQGRGTIYSFLGLGPGKTWQDTVTRAYACVEATLDCRRMSDVPVARGRLASTAVGLYDRIFLFGGYTVAEDGAEVSTPEVFAFNPADETYTRRADMPTPVDDAVAFAYANRYIYLISGWHDRSNVSLVQVFDSWENTWFRATDYPGAPVFGHSGGAVDGRFVVADGVAVVGEADGRRAFGAVNEAWLGEIDESDPSVIDWTKVPAHPGPPLYRMAAVGDARGHRILFAGGADNPYNYNGVGYDGAPATPSSRLFAYDLDTAQWDVIGEIPPTMDHRGLVLGESGLYIVGGMGLELDVLNTISRIMARPG